MKETSLIEDLTNSDWMSVFSDLCPRVVFSYETAALKELARIRETDGSQRAAFTFLVRALSGSTFIIEPSTRARRRDDFNPVEPPWSLTNDELDACKYLVDKNRDPELEARFGDILWLTRKDFDAGKIASSKYLQSAVLLEDGHEWTYCFERYKRSIALAWSIERSGINFREAVLEIERALVRLDSKDPLFLTLRLVELLQSYKVGDAFQQAWILETHKTGGIHGDPRHDIDFQYFAAAAGIFDRLTDREASTRCWRAAGEALVQHAESFMATPGNRGAGAHWLSRAIEVLRKASGTQLRCKELSLKLAEWQRIALEDAVCYEEPLEIPLEMLDKIRQVPTPDALESLIRLATMLKPLSQDVLERSARRESESPAFRIMPPTWGRLDGKTDAVLQGGTAGGELSESDLRKLMHHHARLCWQYSGAIIHVGLSEIKKVHSTIDLRPLIDASKFIPPTRRETFLKGLQAGFEFDLHISLHLLVPQIENSLRYLLAEAGEVTFSLDVDLTQDEHLLQRLLGSPKLLEILGKDTVFDLRGLLIERTGLNLRNELSHGMIPDGRLQAADCLYLWWLIIRLCVLTAFEQASTFADSCENL